MVTFNILLVVILMVALLLILVVMVQQPKSGGLSSAFGGNAQVLGGVQKTTDFLDRSTWTLGTLLIVCVLLANIILRGSDNNTGSRILDGFKNEAPAPQPTTPTLPQTPTK